MMTAKYWRKIVINVKTNNNKNVVVVVSDFK